MDKSTHEKWTKSAQLSEQNVLGLNITLRHETELPSSVFVHTVYICKYFDIGHTAHINVLNFKQYTHTKNEFVKAFQ